MEVVEFSTVYKGEGFIFKFFIFVNSRIIVMLCVGWIRFIFLVLF